MINGTQRRDFTGQGTGAILWRHRVDRVPASDLCAEHGTHPTFFNRCSSMGSSKGP
jgi:hypothetical protein